MNGSTPPAVIVATQPRVLTDGLVAVLEARGIHALAWFGSPEEAPCAASTVLLVSPPLPSPLHVGAVVVVPGELDGPAAAVHLSGEVSTVDLSGLDDLLDLLDVLLSGLRRTGGPPPPQDSSVVESMP